MIKCISRFGGGGSKGKTFSLTARIFAVVDVWYALSSDRPYRPAWTIDAKYHLTTSCRHNSGTVLALERERLLALMEETLNRVRACYGISLRLCRIACVLSSGN